MENLSISIDRSTNETTVKFAGNARKMSAFDLKNALPQLIEPSKTLILDFSELESMDQAGLNALLYVKMKNNAMGNTTLLLGNSDNLISATGNNFIKYGQFTIPLSAA